MTRTGVRRATVVASLALVSLGAIAGPDCKAFENFSDIRGSRVLGDVSEHVVIGTGRLYFHSSPYPNCRLRDVFILPGEVVNAYVEFAGYTAVMYLNKKTGDDAVGWVETTRLRATGRGIAPRDR